MTDEQSPRLNREQTARLIQAVHAHASAQVDAVTAEPFDPNHKAGDALWALIYDELGAA